MSYENNNNNSVNNKTNDNDKPSSSQAAAVLGPKITEALSRRLDERIASLKAEIEELNASNAAWENELKIRCEKLKETKKEIKESKKLAEELKGTRNNLREVGRDLANYNRFLQLDLEKYQAETIQLRKAHKDAIKDMENKWKIYQAQYETLPLAVARTDAEVALKKSKIELMVKKYKLLETKKMIDKRKEIETKQTNNLVVDIAILYKELQSEDTRMRLVMEERKNLLQELAEQEKTLAELEQKQKEKKSVPTVFATEKFDRNMFAAPTQPRRIIPRLDLSFCGASPMQPLPSFRKDNYDTMSVSSSVIDNLIEPESDNLPQIETDEYEIEAEVQGGEDDCDVETLEAAGRSFDDPNEIKEDLDDVSKDKKKMSETPNIRLVVMEVEKEDVEEVNDMKEEGSTAVESIKFQKLEQKYTSAREMMEDIEYKTSDDQKYKETGVEKEKFGTKATGWQLSGIQSRFLSSVNKPGTSFFSESNFLKPLNPEEQLKGRRPEPKRPSVRNIENVNVPLSQIGIVQNKIPPANSNAEKQSDNPSIAKYFTTNSRASSVDFNWQADFHESSNFSFTESQRGNLELDYLPGSEVSMQSGDMAKKFCFSSVFSPYLRDTGDDFTSDKDTVDNNAEKNRNFELSTLRADNPQHQKSANGEEQRMKASQYFNIGGENHGAPENRGNTNNKNGTLFFNMF